MTKELKLLSVTKAAERLGLDPHYVRVLIRTGKIKATKPGHDWVLDERAIIAYQKTATPPKVGWPQGRKKGPAKPK